MGQDAVLFWVIVIFVVAVGFIAIVIFTPVAVFARALVVLVMHLFIPVARANLVCDFDIAVGLVIRLEPRRQPLTYEEFHTERRITGQDAIKLRGRGSQS